MTAVPDMHCQQFVSTAVVFSSYFSAPNQEHIGEEKRIIAQPSTPRKEPQLLQKSDILETNWPLMNDQLIINDVTCLFSAAVAHHMIVIHFHKSPKKLSGENKCILVEKANPKRKFVSFKCGISSVNLLIILCSS